jgi:hypothetical protein
VPRLDRRLRTALDAGTTSIGISTPAHGELTGDDGAFEREFTQVIQALLSGPKASCHAGSRDWKNSSGWKKERRVSAFTMRKASSKAKMPSVESR